RIDKLFDITCDVLAVDFHVQLEVQPQTSRVHVGRTDIRPCTVDCDQFGVVKVTRGTPHPASGADNLIQLRGHGVVDQAQVVTVRDDNIDLYAASCGSIDCAHQNLIGQKIRGLNADMVLC